MRKSKWETGTLVAAAAVIITALVGLAGYLPGFNLNSVDKGYIPMAPSTALAFILFGIAVLLFNYGHAKKNYAIPSLLAVFLVLLFGILDFIGFIVNTELNFESLFVPDAGTLNGIPIARMSPATGAMFFLAGIVFIFIVLCKIVGRYNKIVDYLRGTLSFLLLMISLVFCLAYFYGSPLLYSVTDVIPMAFSTAFGFVFLMLALLSLQKNYFPLRLLFEFSTRGYLLRYILPLAIISVFMGGFGPMVSGQFQNFNPALISALLSVVVLIAAVIITLYISNYIGVEIDKKNAVIEQSNQALIESEQQYRTLFETMAQGVVYQNAEGEIVAANPAAEQILGLSLEQMKGRKSIDPRWKAVDRDKKELPGEEHPAMLALRNCSKVENFVQGIFNPKINDYVWIIVNSIPQFKPGSLKPHQVYSTFLEFTKRKKTEDELIELKNSLEKQVDEKTLELKTRIDELEHFHDVTIEREIRMEELRKEIESLKRKTP